MGGLATYISFLTAALAQTGPVRTISRFERDGSRALDYAAYEPARTLKQTKGVALTIVTPARAMRPLARAARRLVHRRRTQGLAVSLFLRTYEPAMARAIPHDVRHVHWVGNGWEMLGFAALRVARRRGVPFTVWPAIHEGSWGDGSLDARLYTLADRVLAQSAPESAVLRRLGVPSPRIDVIGPGPGVGGHGDGAAFRARHALESRPIVLFIGRKERYKGYHALCDGIMRVRDYIPSTMLVAIGSAGSEPGPSLPMDALLDLGIADDDEKADALAACDVLCLASTGESFGIVYVEAWQYAKPVIVGPSPASRDLVEHGVTGLHVDQRSEDIQDAVLRLLRHPSRAKAMGANGQALQRERYNWRVACERHVESFEAAARTPRARLSRWDGR